MAYACMDRELLVITAIMALCRVTQGGDHRVPISGYRVPVIQGQATCSGSLSTGAGRSEPHGYPAGVSRVGTACTAGWPAWCRWVVYPGWQGQGHARLRALQGQGRVHIRRSCKDRLGQGRVPGQCQNSTEQCQNSARMTPEQP